MVFIQLNSSSLQHRLVARHLVEPEHLLVSSLLQTTDAATRLQVVYPASCMLDLQQLHYADKEWRASSEIIISRLLHKLGLSFLPALPGALQLPLCVDLTYMQGDWVYVEAGSQEQVLRFKRTEYLDLLQQEQALHTRFTVPLTAASPNLDYPQQDEQEIRSAVETITQQRVKARLSESLEIAPLPFSTQSLLALQGRPDVSATELARVIEMDPSLASQVISWANSPYYGAPGSLRSIQDAVVRVLGFELTLSMALGLALSRQIRLPQDGTHGHKFFWRDAVLRAALVEKLVKKMPPLNRPYIGLAYLAGLLHNFGYLVLAEVFPPYFNVYCRNQAANPDIAPMYLERHLFGITRDQIASYLFTTWGLPAEMCVAIRQQHNPKYIGPHFKYSNLLYLADQYLQPDWEANLSKIAAAVYDRLQITPEAALAARQSLDTVTDNQLLDLVRLLGTGR